MGHAEREDMLNELKEERDILVIKLWNVFRKMSDYSNDLPMGDIDLWTMVTNHSSIQNKLGK